MDQSWGNLRKYTTNLLLLAAKWNHTPMSLTFAFTVQKLTSCQANALIKIYANYTVEFNYTTHSHFLLCTTAWYRKRENRRNMLDINVKRYNHFGGWFNLCLFYHVSVLCAMSATLHVRILFTHSQWKKKLIRIHVNAFVC